LQNDHSNIYRSTMIVAIMGGAAATAITQPLDVIRTRLIAQDLGKRKYKNAIDAVETIVKEEGYSGLFKGIVLSEIYRVGSKPS